MTCPYCGEQVISARQRFCHACGAALHYAPGPAAGAPRGAPVAGDPGERLMGGVVVPVPASASSWLAANRTRLTVYGVAIALAAVSLTIVALTLVATLIALAPFLICLAVLYGIARLRWRRNGRWIRYHYHSHVPRR